MNTQRTAVPQIGRKQLQAVALHRWTSAAFTPTALLNTKRSILTDLDVSPMADSSKEEKWRWIALLHQIAISLTPNVARRDKHMVALFW
jgi:hypothetical protein